jgi:hypothetical protein
LTSKRPRRQVENDEYAAFVQRVLRTYTVASAMATSRPWPSCSAEDIDAAIGVAVQGLRERGYS